MRNGHFILMERRWKALSILVQLERLMITMCPSCLKGNDLDAKPNLIWGNVAGVGKPKKGENHRWGTNQTTATA